MEAEQAEQNALAKKLLFHSLNNANMCCQQGKRNSNMQM